MKIGILFLLWTIIGLPVLGFELSPVLQSNMVVQQGKIFRIWGKARAGERLTVRASWSPEVLSVTADSDGEWVGAVKVPYVKAGDFTSHHLVVASSGQTVTLENLLIGEVWFFSGQSNMNMTMEPFLPWHKGILNHEEEIASADYPYIRLFTTRLNVAENPTDRVEGVWEICNPETVRKFSAVAFSMGRKLFKELNIPVGLVVSSRGAMSCQAFTSREVLESHPSLKRKYLTPYLCAPDKVKKGAVPCKLYNGMIYPFRYLSIRGFGWYQGENNCNDGDIYALLCAEMVKGWRKVFEQGNLPFYFVQMTPYNWKKKDFYGGTYAYFREIQQKTMQLLPESGMVVTMDVGEPDCIHPVNKKPVGERLAALALHREYGFKKRVCTGPEYTGIHIDGQQVFIRFKKESLGTGLKTSDNREPMYFYLAGKSRKFFQARARIEGDQVIVSCPEVKEPVAVRYAFLTYPVTNLENQEGFPAVPFRTDDWEDACYMEEGK